LFSLQIKCIVQVCAPSPKTRYIGNATATVPDVCGAKRWLKAAIDTRKHHPKKVKQEKGCAKGYRINWLITFPATITARNAALIITNPKSG
jgi:hypothetical protein